MQLTKMELCEGLIEIGDSSFRYCNHLITKINILNSLRRIKDRAFFDSLRTPIRLNNDIESIEEYAFAHSIFTNFRVTPLITVIPVGVLQGCSALFSVEIPIGVTDTYWTICIRILLLSTKRGLSAQRCLPWR